MLAIIAPALVLAAFLSFGRKLYFAIGLEKKPGLTYPASFALAMVFSGLFMTVAGFLGLYNRVTGYLLILGMLLVSYKEFEEVLEETKQALYGVKAISAIAVLFMVWAGYVFLTALTPPVYYDSLVYHLGVASQYIARGGIADLPGNIFSYFPQLISMNYLLCLLLSGPVCVKIFQFYTAVMAVAAVYSIAKHYKAPGFIAALLLFTSPLFVLNATRAGVDLPVMFFSMLLLLFVLLKGQDGFKMADNVFIGIILGAALASKYTSAIIYVFFVLYMAMMLFKKKENVSGFIAAAVIPVLIMVPYLVKNMIQTGNPVYPFLSGVFTGKPGLAEQAASYVSHVSGFGPGLNVLEFIKSPWTLTVNPFVFGGDAAAGLILVTIVLVLCGLAGHAKTAVFFLLFYYTAWYFTGPVLRFLLPAEAVCAVIAAVIYTRAKSAARVFALGALVVFQVVVSVYFVEKYLRPFSLFAGSNDKYLSKSVSYHKAAVFLNGYDKNRRPVLLLGEARVFYFEMPVYSYTVFNNDEIFEGFEEGGTGNFMREFMECKAGHLMKRFREQRAGYLMVNRTELLRLKDAGYGGVYRAYNSAGFKNIMDKYFKKLYIDTDCEIYEYKG